MKIIITGTPGTGKSIISKKLSKKLGIEIIDVKKLIERKNAYKVNKFGEKEVSMPKFRDFLKEELKKKKDWIIESHLLCEIKLNGDFIFVFRCGKKELEKRLKKRKYRKEKIEDNLMVELLDYCYLKSKKNNKGKLFELDTTKRSVGKCVEEIEKAVNGKKKKLDEVNYSKELMEYVLKGKI